MLEMTYYTRKQCPLCDEGKEQINLALSELRYNDVKMSAVDIDKDDALQEEYMIRVPVLVHEGNVVQEGIIDFAYVYDYLKTHVGK
ncbi:glutaredoxin family protein [Salinicoccus hispanicus]|uniref:Thioredoxin family protein n=1 Tax=Salinicoccus hispanicus TaxID=157225 RepID=A0A6N8U2Y8_9STAP|nr:glutaredoxin family protein [Salinicoccus hispanicus]MXQ50755.1 thioredoxin family protein [Salinicoccus hispanicus]